MDVMTRQTVPCEELKLLHLPAEIRIAILEYVFNDNRAKDGFTNLNQPGGQPGGIIVDEDYGANECLQPLLTCRQIYEDGNLLALTRTNFVISNLFFQIPKRLDRLHPKQIAAVRSIAFVADARHFRKLVDWRKYPFNMPNLYLDTLSIVLHRSSFWHYLFDFTDGLAMLLRSLHGLRRFVIVKNNALVKGSFKTWYNRLIDLMIKIDHHERYGKVPPNPEQVWWKWSYDEIAQSACFEACPTKPVVDEETYWQLMEPLVEELRVGKENEEWNPDPRSRTMYY